MKKTSLLVSISFSAALLTVGCTPMANNSNATTTGNTNKANTATVTNSNSTNTATMNTNTGGAETNSNSNANAGGAATNMGVNFIDEAAQGGLAEIKLGEMAQTKAQNAEVKAYAKKMIADHTKANAELKTVADKKTKSLPVDVNATQKATAERLSKLSGAEFDKEYMKVQVEDHEKTVALFTTESSTGTDAETKALAAKSLPEFKMHLDMAKALSSKMK